MKKSVLALTPALFMLTVFGCQELQVQKGNPKQGIKNVLAKLQDAYAKEDIDGIMALYSEDYEGANGEGKSSIEELLNGLKDQGYMTDMEVVLDDVKIEVKGDTATAAPIKYAGNWGEVEYKTTFKKEGSTWKAISAEEYYGE